METIDRLNDVFRSVFADESIELVDTMTADDVEGWDSIAHVSLIFAIEEAFEITFSTEDLESIANVGDMRVAIGKHLGVTSG